MAQEIERKFLVNSDAFKNEAFQKHHIQQGYLSTHPDRTVRIRIKDTKAYITIKGRSSESGMSRYEWEQEIKLTDANDLMQLCERNVIDKNRYEIKAGEVVYEVDEFLGENAGLIVAEIELKHENDIFEKPHWLGEEVTGDKRYYNSNLMTKQAII
ncbi:MAG: adenylate cyclase [Porphyromonadaceae bacterium CG2_30_38_12]|nr:MAG: adenylate cyclase [Porphyromonadaceae bacterium CG2_30_38_12]